MCLVGILDLLAFLRCAKAHLSLVHILFSQDYLLSQEHPAMFFSWQQDQNF